MVAWMRTQDTENGRSPYYFPYGVRAVASRDSVRIEFRYIDGSEPATRTKLEGGLMLFEGRHTGRILAIELEPGFEDLRVRLDDAWRRILRREAPRGVDYGMPYRAYESRIDELLAAATGAVV